MNESIPDMPNKAYIRNILKENGITLNYLGQEYSIRYFRRLKGYFVKLQSDHYIFCYHLSDNLNLKCVLSDHRSNRR